MRRVWEICPADLEMGDLLGVGASGQVYKATWGGTAVAVKKLKSGVMNEDFESEMFSQEIGMLGPCVVANAQILCGPYDMSMS